MAAAKPNPALLAVAWAVLAGCGGTGPAPDWNAVRDTLPSGTIRVTHVPGANVSPAWTLVEELRVGTAEGAGPDAFAYLKGLVVLPSSSPSPTPAAESFRCMPRTLSSRQSS